MIAFADGARVRFRSRAEEPRWLEATGPNWNWAKYEYEVVEVAEPFGFGDLVPGDVIATSPEHRRYLVTEVAGEGVYYGRAGRLEWQSLGTWFVKRGIYWVPCTKEVSE